MRWAAARSGSQPSVPRTTHAKRSGRAQGARCAFGRTNTHLVDGLLALGSVHPLQVDLLERIDAVVRCARPQSTPRPTAGLD
jgi:hypothetical protein